MSDRFPPAYLWSIATYLDETGAGFAAVLSNGWLPAASTVPSANIDAVSKREWTKIEEPSATFSKSRFN